MKDKIKMFVDIVEEVQKLALNQIKVDLLIEEQLIQLIERVDLLVERIERLESDG